MTDAPPPPPQWGNQGNTGQPYQLTPKQSKALAKADRPLWKKKRVIIPGALVALIVAVSATSGGEKEGSEIDASPPTSTSASTSAAASSPATTEAAVAAPASTPAASSTPELSSTPPPSSEPVAAEPSSAEPTTAEATTSAAAPEPPSSSPAPVVAKPTTYKGTGDKVLKIQKPDGPAVAFITGGKANENFAIFAKDPAGENIDLLVNKLEAYKGIRPLDVQADQKTAALAITAKGPWTVEIRSIESVRSFASGKITGSGDEVLRYTGKNGAAQITGNKAAQNFAITTYPVDGGLLDFPALPVNVLEAYSGEVSWDENTLVVVMATGPWTIDVN